jgi:hypothetical protein
MLCERNPSLFFSLLYTLNGLVSFQMFEINMDEYLDEEVEFARETLESICRVWDRKVCAVMAIQHMRLFLVDSSAWSSVQLIRKQHGSVSWVPESGTRQA